MTINRRMMLAGSASLALVASGVSLITPLYGAAFRRTEWTSTTPDGIRNRESLIRGWRAMKARGVPASPTDDILSVAFHVFLHSLRGVHRGYHFLTWHMGFLLMFEAAIRRLSNDPEFSLPYLDFSKSRVLPPEFRDPTSPLYHAARNPTINAGGAISLAAVQWERSIRNPTTGAIWPFITSDGTPNFGGVPSPPLTMGPMQGGIESQPHGPVHMAIGGDMADLGRAPNDILFYLLHSWIQMFMRFRREYNGGQHYPNDPAWLGTVFRFPDAAGIPADRTVQQLLIADYPWKYEQFPTFTPLAQPLTAMAAGTLRVASAPEVLATKGNVPLPTRKTTVAVALSHPPRSGSILLTFDRITCDVPGIWHQVFVNAPAGTTNPSPTGPYFVGNVALVAHNGSCGAIDQVFDVTNQVAGKNTCNITFIPMGDKNVLNSRSRTGSISKIIVKG